MKGLFQASCRFRRYGCGVGLLSGLSASSEPVFTIAGKHYVLFYRHFSVDGCPWLRWCPMCCESTNHTQPELRPLGRRQGHPAFLWRNLRPEPARRMKRGPESKSHDPRPGGFLFFSHLQWELLVFWLAKPPPLPHLPHIAQGRCHGTHKEGGLWDEFVVPSFFTSRGSLMFPCPCPSSGSQCPLDLRKQHLKREAQAHSAHLDISKWVEPHGWFKRPLFPLSINIGFL